MAKLQWFATCGVDQSRWIAEMKDDNDPAKMSFCPDCQQRGMAAPGVLNWKPNPGLEIRHMARKFFIGSFNGTYVVYEQVRGGCRAVSPRYFEKKEAESALSILSSDPTISRIKRA